MSDPNPQMTAAAPSVDESLVSYTHVMYALHSLAVGQSWRTTIDTPKPAAVRVLLHPQFGASMTE